MRRRTIQGWISLLWVALTAFCMPFAVLAIDVESSEQGSLTAEGVRQELSRLPRDVGDVDVRITIGVAAFRAALASTDSRPIVAAFITSTDFQSAFTDGPRPSNVTAIFSNPDPLDQVSLARALLGTPRLGVVASPRVASQVDGLAQSGIRTIPYSSGQPIDTILRAATQTDAIVALPDSSVFNQANIGHVVRTLYGRRKVLIGYSETLTKVGGLASVHVPQPAINKRIADVINTFATTGSLEFPSFVDDIDISVNEQLARSLNISVPQKATLIAAVHAGRSKRTP